MTFNNLTLYTTSAVLILDTDGNRVIAKYYQPPHAANFLSTATPAQQNAVAATTPQLSAKNPLATLKEQRAFEKAIYDKTKRATGDIILYDSHLVLFKTSLDVIFYVVGPAAENELMLSGLLGAFYDATSMLVRHQVEKRAILENLDLVTLALDETVDDGIILETDSTTIASRVSRPRPDVNEIQINEQSKCIPRRMLRQHNARTLTSFVFFFFFQLCTSPYSHHERILEPQGASRPENLARRSLIVHACHLISSIVLPHSGPPDCDMSILLTCTLETQFYPGVQRHLILVWARNSCQESLSSYLER